MPNTYYDSDLTGEQIEAALKAIDGVIAPSNNGKVLAIEDGKIVAKSASEWTDTPVLEPVTITHNGTTTPPSGVDGFNSVTVAVPGAGNIEPITITENGTYSPPSGVDGYAPVTVNVSGGSVLPSGYTQKQYLEASGTQYIDTGIKAQGGCYAEVEFEFVASIDGWHSIISGANANVISAFKLMHNGMTIGTVQYYNSYHDFGKSFQIGQKYFACISNGLSIDNEFIASFYKTAFISDNNIGLFATITGSAEVEAYFTGRIYSCRIWLDGVIVRDFIPCIRDSDSVAGMYDIVNDVFYANAGTGSFAYA